MSGKPGGGGLLGEPQPVRIIVKKKGGGDHHGGSWKVAYADFITALMALFLLLWLIGSSSQEQKKAIAGYFRDDPVAMPGKPSPGTGILEGNPSMDYQAAHLDSVALSQARMTLERLFDKEGAYADLSGHVRIQLTDEGLQVDIVDKANDVLFDVGSSSIKAAADTVLVEIARAVGKLDNRIVIGGHTDSRPFTGSGRSNWELSTERANNARQIMAQAGLPEDHLALVAGYADTRLLFPDDPHAAANRRISVTVLRKNAPQAALDKLGVKDVNLRRESMNASSK